MAGYTGEEKQHNSKFSRSINSLIVWIRRPENTLAVSIALLLFILHIVALVQVEDYIWDEETTAGEANYVLHGWQFDDFYRAFAEKHHGITSEEEYLESGFFIHMPLGKLFVAASVAMFGDNNVGWRFFTVLFGAISIILFYLVCQELTSKRWIPLIATFVFSFENMCFVVSGISIFEVFGFTFMLAAFLLYLRGRFVWAGILLGIGIISRLFAVLGGLVILGHWLLTRRKPAGDIAGFLIAAPAVLVLLTPLLDYIGAREMVYPWDRLMFLFDYQEGRFSFYAHAPTHFRELFLLMFPWDWLVSPDSMSVWENPSYEFNLSWTLWVVVIPVMCYMVYETIMDRGNRLCSFALLWFLFAYFPWFLVYWIFDERLSYPYYFYPAVGAICLAMGYTLWRILSFASLRRNPAARWAIRFPAMSWMAAHFAMFWIMAPVA